MKLIKISSTDPFHISPKPAPSLCKYHHQNCWIFFPHLQNSRKRDEEEDNPLWKLAQSRPSSEHVCLRHASHLRSSQFCQYFWIYFPASEIPIMNIESLDKSCLLDNDKGCWNWICLSKVSPAMMKQLKLFITLGTLLSPFRFWQGGQWRGLIWFWGWWNYI